MWSVRYWLCRLYVPTPPPMHWKAWEISQWSTTGMETKPGSQCLDLKHFSIQKKCQRKLDCLIYEIFLLVNLNRILALSLTLSMQNVSHRTMLSQSLHLNHIYNTLLHFLSHLFVNTSLHLTWTFQLDNAVMRTAKFCWFLIPLVFLFWNVSQKLL